MNTLAVALLSVVLSVAAQFCLKTGMGNPAVSHTLAQPLSFSTGWVLLTQPYLLVGFCFYGVGALVWLKVLAQWDVSKAYPLVGFGFVLTFAIGYFAGEQVSLARAVGITLICLGVLVVART